jgi:hypothetical protein
MPSAGYEPAAPVYKRTDTMQPLEDGLCYYESAQTRQVTNII